MVSTFMHILFAAILGVSLAGSIPKGTLIADVYNFDCEITNTFLVEEFYMSNTHITFDTLDRGYIKVSKTEIKEIHFQVAKTEGSFLIKSPAYEVENILNSDCRESLAFDVNISGHTVYN